MDTTTTTPMENTNQQVSIDPWEAAFAAINKEATQAATPPEQKDTTAVSDNSTMDQATEGTNGNTNADGTLSNENQGVYTIPGGSDNNAGVLSGEDEDSDEALFTVSQEDIDTARQSIKDAAEETAIQEVAQSLISKGVRHNNGVLGASINDPDIMKRDADGVPHFYNPDTKQEFTGDNPRRQAAEWCEDYNRELANIFNKACDQRVNEIMTQSSNQLQVLEFAPTYNGLDPIRQQMFDSLIEDYEVKDSNGNAIGYSIDLNKALQTVNRQVQMIQEYTRARQQSPATSSESASNSGPALDMKNNAGTQQGQQKPKFNSVAEAMEYLQQQELNKRK